MGTLCSVSEENVDFYETKCFLLCFGETILFMKTCAISVKLKYVYQEHFTKIYILKLVELDNVLLIKISSKNLK